jgi:hypothetical protein
MYRAVRLRPTAWQPACAYREMVAALCLSVLLVSVDVYFHAQTRWMRGEDIDVPFQMDGDSRRPYSVWLSNVTLTASF